MDIHPSLTDALGVALQLAPKERLQLIEQIAASVVADIDMASVQADDEPSTEHWGKALNRLMDDIGTIME